MIGGVVTAACACFVSYLLLASGFVHYFTLIGRTHLKSSLKRFDQTVLDPTDGQTGAFEVSVTKTLVVRHG